MIESFLVFWVISAFFVVKEQKSVRLIIYLGIFSLISAVCIFLLSAPDVAMVKGSIGIFSTIMFIVCFEKCYILSDNPYGTRAPRWKIASKVVPAVFTLCLAALVFAFIPNVPVGTYLRDLYLERFVQDIGGYNAVTAIYLGYRMYDILFEALVLIVCIIAVIHLSWCENEGDLTEKWRPSSLSNSGVAVTTIRIICPVILMFCVYLSIGSGGFKGGLFAGAFFVCRYIIYDIHDIRINRVMVLQNLTYVALLAVTVYFIFLGANANFLIPGVIYLPAVNILIGLMVACVFLSLFYRFIVFEKE